MHSTLEPTTPCTYGQLELRLLRRAAFTAPYVPQMIDFIVREVTGCEDTPPSAEQAARIHSELARFAAHGQPGGLELARTMLDVRHAVDLVHGERYRASAVPRMQPDTVVSETQLLELAVRAGRERVLPAQGEVLVIIEADGTSTVYRPVTPAEASAVRMSARNAKEAAVRLNAAVVELLTPHTQMADWSRPDGYGVTVAIEGDGVSVSWWPASLPETFAQWEQGGIRQLCNSLLSSVFTTTEADNAITCVAYL
ncbi:hypothetical protein ACFXKW_26595 [Streptomyces sp. NPDC059193]|uniref:hypothetical protein n=1 Tax=Streptomyces sp. NPDC059193 TaxID=3346763 RepID=UPI003694700B